MRTDFCLDNGHRTKVKVSVRNHSPQFRQAGKHAALPPWHRTTAEQPASRRITVPNMASSRLSVFVAVAWIVFSVAAWAQKDAGSIVGTVKDQTGAIVAKAKVTVSDVDRGTYLETATNDSGEYVASPLRVGRYKVTVEHPGFKK